MLHEDVEAGLNGQALDNDDAVAAKGRLGDELSQSTDGPGYTATHERARISRSPEKLETIESQKRLNEKFTINVDSEHSSKHPPDHASEHGGSRSQSQVKGNDYNLQSQTPPSEDSSPAHQPSATFRRRRQHYNPVHQTRLLNNLLPIVGFLELTNALDFPANVWNTIPVDLFAVGLMATGGSICVIVSFFAFYDFSLSYKNFLLLRQERKYLKEAKDTLSGGSDREKDDARLSTCQAWLDLNFREIGWEFTDRMLMDSLNGFAGILVGAGTMLAIGGANPRVFRASNLLSGYIGNSFNVLYGAANTVWSVYMWKRSRMYKRAVNGKVKNEELRKRMLGHIRRHELYAVVNGLTVFVAAIGSMVSATMWQGYVVLLPCVFGAVISNFLWRRGIGYDRELAPRRSSALEMDIEKRLIFAIDAQEVTKNKGGDALLEKLNEKEVIGFMLESDMLEDFCVQMLHNLSPGQNTTSFRTEEGNLMVDSGKLESLDEGQLIKSARQCLSKKGTHRFRDQERTLAELWGCQLSQPSGRRSSHVEITSPVEKEV